MTTEIALTTGIGVLAGVVSLLYKRLAKTDAAQEKRLVRTESRLDQCEEDRANLRKEMTDIYKHLAGVKTASDQTNEQ